MKLLLVLPKGIEVECVYYLQGDLQFPSLFDLDELDSPLDNPNSYLNYKMRRAKSV